MLLGLPLPDSPTQRFVEMFQTEPAPITSTDLPEGWSLSAPIDPEPLVTLAPERRNST
jgi:hypothetical protein